MSKSFGRLTKTTIQVIVADLNKFAQGDLGRKITWSLIEDRHGFSRQALQARPEIKAAYINAKTSLSGELVRNQKNASMDLEELRVEVTRMKIEIDEFRRMRTEWMARWQRIAFHIRQSGLQVYKMDREIPKNSQAPNERSTADILRPFDKEIPGCGRS